MSEIVFNPQNQEQSNQQDLQSQIQNLQTTLASLNQQIIILQEALQERDQQIKRLKEVKETRPASFPYFFIFALTFAIILTFVFQINFFGPFWELLFSAVIVALSANYIKNFFQKFLGSK